MEKKVKQAKKVSKKSAPSSFEVVHPVCAGIDVGASKHYVAVHPSLTENAVRCFDTHTQGIEDLASWLLSLGIESVVMESTGVYWQTLYELLESKGFKVCLANAYHVRHVPGRKTDVKDSQWLQQLHSFGLLQPSFIPEAQVRQLRSYLRLRHQYIEEKASCLNRIEKSLQQMNVKLKQVISKIDTQVGMNIVRAIVAGERDGAVLADRFYTSQLKASKASLALALQGIWKKEVLFALSGALEGYDFHHKQMVACEEEIEEILQQFTPKVAQEQNKEIANQIEKEEKSKGVERKPKSKKVRQNEYHFDVKHYLQSILGVDVTAIEGLSENTVLDIVGEVGTDLSRWKSAAHFTSWLGLAPQPQISGGKIIKQYKKQMRSRATQAFRMAAYSLHAAKCELGRIFRKVSSVKGTATAVKTVARKLAVIFYSMVSKQTCYDPQRHIKDLEAQQVKKLKWVEKQAQKLGYGLVPVSS